MNNNIKIGDKVIDLDNQVCDVLDIFNGVIKIQHYPNKKWYIQKVKCDKCGGVSKLKMTSTLNDKFLCGHKIPGTPKGELFPIEKCYTCNSKKFTEINRKHTGIKYYQHYLLEDFNKLFKIV